MFTEQGAGWIAIHPYEILDTHRLFTAGFPANVSIRPGIRYFSIV
jgi:hypothetical protein